MSEEQISALVPWVGVVGLPLMMLLNWRAHKLAPGSPIEYWAIQILFGGAAIFSAVILAMGGL